MKIMRISAILAVGLFLAGLGLGTVSADDFKTSSENYKNGVPDGCKIESTTICTIEVWLAHKHKKNKRALRKELKSKQIKVLHHTFQFWKPRGGHPPTNIAIGRGLSAEDARWVIDFALKNNDRITGLVQQRLNPPHYVAIATSAWDADSETAITPEQLEQLRDPALTTEQFHKLYVQFTGEAGAVQKFY